MVGVRVPCAIVNDRNMHGRMKSILELYLFFKILNLAYLSIFFCKITFGFEIHMLTIDILSHYKLPHRYHQ